MAFCNHYRLCHRKVSNRSITSQSWIGGKSLADAFFISPHPKYVNELMGDSENFLHNDDLAVPDLVRIGIIHFQFETIHPFLDGNGRIGRLMITLFLVSKGILEKPLLYLSDFFESDKELYYDNLTRVRTHNDMLQWLKYFLVGIEQTATKGIETLSSLLNLKNQKEQEIQQMGKRSAKGLLLLQALFKTPIVDAQDVSTFTGLSKKAANDLISDLQRMGILVEITGQNRGRIYSFDPYLNCFANTRGTPQ